MRRREFMALLAGTATWPLATHAQSPGRRPVVGFLGPTTAAVSRNRTAVFSQRMRELGWSENANIDIDYRWADGRSELFAELAADLVHRNVDIIVTWGTATVGVAQQATRTIPIVFALVSDPVGSGFVASLARPAGNLTGLSTQHHDAAGKRLEILRELVPTLRRLGIMANAGNPASVVEIQEVQRAARSLGVDVVTREVRSPEDIAGAFATIAGRVDALFFAPEQLFQTARSRLAALALDQRLPTMHGFKEPVAAGGLVSYGPDYLDMFRRTADFVDRILRGGSPAEIPVEQPTKFELVLNLKTAKALGLDIPATLLARADEVIE
jgi:putative tryptophan/tyrosine transport system substrate-binding protein